MKKLLIVFFILITSGCNMFLTDSDYIDMYTENISNAIVDNDSASFKELFSPNVMYHYDDFDNTMNDIFNYIEGSLVSYRNYAFSSTSGTHYGYKEEYFKYAIEIITSMYTYELYVVVCHVNDIDEDGIGFRYIKIQRVDGSYESIEIGSMDVF